MQNKTTQLKSLLTSPNLEFILEAHDGLSAKIVEEAGFKGIWAADCAFQRLSESGIITKQAGRKYLKLLNL